MADFLKRFEREVKALAKLSHFHIVKIHDYGEQDGRSYLVMEYIPGGTLRERMAGRPVPYPQAARWLAPIARALEYAHRQGIIHRDVKPANILFNEHGDLLLSDFGIARLVEQQTMASLTMTGASIGTPDYMAPEQWEGKPTTQSDIYALGAVFYELVTGMISFDDHHNPVKPVTIIAVRNGRLEFFGVVKP